MTWTPPNPILREDELQANFESLEIYLREKAESVCIAKREGALTLGAGAGYSSVKPDTALVDIGGNFSTANGYYVAPTEGIYQVNGPVRGKYPAGGTGAIAIFVNGTQTLEPNLIEAVAVGGVWIGCAAGLIKLPILATVELRVFNTTAVEIAVAAGDTELSIFRVL